MNISEQAMNCANARQVDMVDYLSSIGFEAIKIRRADYWYHSPLHVDKTPSFKVNRALNRWYDHGLGKGGNLIDFAVIYHACTIGDFLQNLRNGKPFQISSHSKTLYERETEPDTIQIKKVGPLSHPYLLNYILSRKVSIPIARSICHEIHYQINHKTYYSIGFRNDKGGYELRNQYFKGSAAPKASTIINNGARSMAVFEGFFDFLSFLTIHENQVQEPLDYLILNSISFFQSNLSFITSYDVVLLFLDNDTAGQNCSQMAVKQNPRFIDQASLYKPYKDLNEWHTSIGKGPISILTG